MIISVCQPHFLPWIGYFKMIAKCDKFIFLDNVNYNRRSWQNRCHILSTDNQNKELISLSIISPSQTKKINECYIHYESILKILNKIYTTYKNTKFFNVYFKDIEKIILKYSKENLSIININLIKYLNRILDIKMISQLNSNFNIAQKKEYLILELLKKNNAQTYFANEGSLNYANHSFFEKNNINFKTNVFEHPTYNQYNKNFISHLSIVDCLFFCGNKTKNLL